MDGFSDRGSIPLISIMKTLEVTFSGCFEGFCFYTNLEFLSVHLASQTAAFRSAFFLTKKLFCRGTPLRCLTAAFIFRLLFLLTTQNIRFAWSRFLYFSALSSFKPNRRIFPYFILKPHIYAVLAKTFVSFLLDNSSQKQAGLGKVQ